jgi:hypothetical protein
LQSLVAGSLEVEKGQLIVGGALRLAANALKQIGGDAELSLAFLQLAGAQQSQAQAVPDLGLVLTSSLLLSDGQPLL